MVAVRFWHGLIVIVGVTVAVFVVTRLISDPVNVMLPLEASAEERAAFAARLGLDRPIWAQFVDYLGQLARLDLGTSLWQNRPALTIVMEHLPITLLLVVTSVVVRHRGGDTARRRRGAPPGRLGRPGDGGAEPRRAVGPAVLARAPADPVLRGDARGAAERRCRVGGASRAAGGDAGDPDDDAARHGDAVADDRRAERAVRAHARGQGSLDLAGRGGACLAQRRRCRC